MRKALCWLVLSLLCVAGCLRIDTRAKTYGNDGRLEVTAGQREVSAAIHQLIAARGWTSEGGGDRTVSTSSVGTGSGQQPPERRRAESVETWIYARTGNGKIVHFEIGPAGGRLIAIRVGVEDGARVSQAEVTDDLARRLHVPARPRRVYRGSLTIRLAPFDKSPTEPNAYTAHWTTRGDWPYPNEYVQFEVREGDRISRCYSIHLDHPALWSILQGDWAGEPTRVRFERPAGVMVLEGRDSHPGAGGTLTFEPNAAYVKELTRIAPPGPTTSELLELFCWPVDLNYARQMKQALAGALTFPELRTLSNHHVTPDYVGGSRAAGYAFSVEQLVRLANDHVPLETLRGFKQAGYDFSVEQFLQIRNHRVNVEDAGRFRQMGYDFSLDDLIKLRNYGVPAPFITQLHDPAYENFTADELIDFHQKRMSAEAINKIRTAKRKTQP